MAEVRIEPVTPARWRDLVELFRTSAVMRGCWCLWPRLPRGSMQTGPENEARLRAIVDGGTIPGLLASLDGAPAGWCSVGPRAHYGRFFGADAPADVWLIACLFITSGQRGRRVGATLVEAAAGYAAARGARRLEALPRGWRPDDDPATMAAVLRLFHRAGFTEQTDGAPCRLRRDLIVC
jgi:GNAT superfamily N-acetyltransferase